MGNLRLTAPIYLLTSRETCYRCGKVAPVVALSCSKFSDDGEDESEESEPTLVAAVNGAVAFVGDDQVVEAR